MGGWGGGVRLTITPSFPLLTALHHAALGNNSVAAKVLVQAKAPVGVVNRLGKSPLVIAQEQRNRYIMQMLTVEEGRGNQRGVVNILLYNQVRHVPGSGVLGSGYAGVRGWGGGGAMFTQGGGGGRCPPPFGGGVILGGGGGGGGGHVHSAMCGMGGIVSYL